MARPRKHGEGPSRPVSFRLSQADFDAYQEKCRAAGMKPSDFFRECVLKNKTAIVARRKPPKDLRRMLHLMNKTSNNVNQLAHRANADHLAGLLDPQGYERILYALETIATLMKAAVRNADPN